MTRTAARKVNYSSRQASYGNLAYDLDYHDREYLLNHAGEAVARPEAMPRRRSRSQVKTRAGEKVAVRARVHVPALPVLGFLLAAVLMIGVLYSYIQLTQISHSVVSIEEELQQLQQENLALTTQYEMTFDFSTIKENAEASGMDKIRSSQIYYVDLSAGDNAVAYESETVSPLSRILTSLGNGICAVVEYFR